MNGCPVKVSVVIPVYNVESYLSDCLNSCLHQTLYDAEFICVNDGSTDGSAEILEAYASKDKRIRILNKVNGGLSSARNAGMKIARGQWIMFLDSDDILMPNACERVWSEGLEAPTDIIVFGTKLYPEISEPDYWYKSVLRVADQRFGAFTPSVLFDKKGSIPFVWRQAFRREFLQEHKVLFDEAVRYGEDTVFQLQVFPHGKHFAYISDQLYGYRWRRPGSLMAEASKNKDDKIANHLYMLEVIAAYWEKQGWIEAYGASFLDWMLGFIVPDTYEKVIERRDEHLQKFCDLIQRYGFDGYFKELSWRGKRLVRLLPKQFYRSKGKMD